LAYVQNIEEEDKMDQDTYDEIIRQQNTMIHKIKRYKNQIIDEEKQTNSELASMLSNNIELIR